MGDQKMRTREIKGGGQNPKWDQTFQITVNDILDEIAICVYDEDIVSKDHVGSTSLKLQDLENVDDWFTIMFEGVEAGKVHLSGKWKPNQAAQE